MSLCVVCKISHRVRKRAAMGIDKLLGGLSFVRFGMALAILTVHNIAVFLPLFFYHSLHLCFTDDGSG